MAASEEKVHPRSPFSNPLHHRRDCSSRSRRSDHPMLSSRQGVWFPAVSSPLLSSPARDPTAHPFGHMGSRKKKQKPKTKTKKKALMMEMEMRKGSSWQLSNGGMFARSFQQQQQQQQQDIEAEDPTSPKVSCMGQVRASYSGSRSRDQNSCDGSSAGAGDGGAVEAAAFPCGSRFFGSPAPASPLTSTTKAAGLPRWSAQIFFRRSSGKELEEAISSSMAAAAAAAAPAAAPCQESMAHGSGRDRKKGSRIWRMAFPKKLLRRGDLKGSDGRKEAAALKAHHGRIGATTGDGAAADEEGPMSEARHGALEQAMRSAYDELPSLLHRGAGGSGGGGGGGGGLKVSLEVVPETWLWRDAGQKSPRAGDGSSRRRSRKHRAMKAKPVQAMSAAEAEAEGRRINGGCSAAADVVQGGRRRGRRLEQQQLIVVEVVSLEEGGAGGLLRLWRQEGEAAAGFFSRSRSATSCGGAQRLICLQRSNSEPSSKKTHKSLGFF